MVDCNQIMSPKQETPLSVLTRQVWHGLQSASASPALSSSPPRPAGADGCSSGGNSSDEEVS